MMSTSTDAYLVFGVQIEEWEEQMNKEQGELPEEFRNPEEDDDSTVYIGELADEHCEMISHCHHECPMWIATPKRIEMHRAWRGYPQEISPDSLATEAQDIEHLKDFCDKLGVEYTEPKWWLCSYWG